MGSISSGAPPLADSAPPAEATAANAGSGGQGSRWDHQHPRLTSVGTGTLNASGEATVSFTRTFDAMPGMTCFLVEAADNPPVMFKVKSWVQDGNGKYTGCVIKGYRGLLLPASLTLVTALASFNVFAGVASGAAFTYIAVQQS